MAEMFLKLDGIKGQSLVTQYKDQIECLSFTEGVSHQVSSDISNETRTVGRPDHQDFTIMKYVDVASPHLIEYCNKGEDVKSAVFTLTHSDGKGVPAPLWIVTMEKCAIGSVSFSVAAGSEPVESVAFNFATIKWEFKAQTIDVEEKGTKASGWDLTKNKVLGGK